MTPWILGAALVVGLSSVAYGQWERASRVEAEGKLVAAETLLRNNEAALKRLNQERATTVSALSDVTEALRVSTTSLQEARSVTHAAPPSNACAAHPGVRALRDSLQRRAAASAGNRAAPAR